MPAARLALLVQMYLYCYFLHKVKVKRMTLIGISFPDHTIAIGDKVVQCCRLTVPGFPV